MHGQASRRPRDPNLLAKLIVDITTGEAPNVKPKPSDPARRKGGLKGEKARAKKVSAITRKKITRKAARMRWSR